MTLQRKLPLIILAIVVVLLMPYFIWHAEMDAYFASESYQEWLVSVRPYAWAVAIGLIVADLFLPIPAAPIMAAMGTLYGPVAGAVAYLLLEEVLSQWTQHWMVVMGPLLVLVVIFARRGLWGLVERDGPDGGNSHG